MSGYGYKRKWLRAGKVLEYYIYGGPWAKTSRDSEYQLYQAVLDGEVRVRCDGKSIEDFSQIRGKSFSDDRPYVLPFDFQLNLEDVERIWDWSKFDIADLLARGLVRSISAEMRMETNNLNLDLLLRRVEARLSAMSLEEAIVETEFKSRWHMLVREQDLLQGSGLVSSDRASELLADYEHIKGRETKLMTSADKASLVSGQIGRKPIYDWLAAAEHVRGRFEYHGPLSPDDPKWSCQADVERELKKYFLDIMGKEPATSTVRERAKQMIKNYQVGKPES